MPLKSLDAHTSIAWDFDRTLIDNPHASLFYNYIRQTPEKRHVIVTFRTHGMQNTMFEELEHSGDPDAPDASNFDMVLNIADEAWAAWNTAASKRKFGMLQGPLTKPETYYINWKGMTCKQHRLSILIDDDIGNTAPGCVKYGITLFNSITLHIV